MPQPEKPFAAFLYEPTSEGVSSAPTVVTSSPWTATSRPTSLSSHYIAASLPSHRRPSMRSFVDTVFRTDSVSSG